MSDTNATNSIKPKRHFQQQRKDAPPRIVDQSVDIKDLSRTETSPPLNNGEEQRIQENSKKQEQLVPEEEDSHQLRHVQPIQQGSDIHYSQHEQPVQQKMPYNTLHLKQQDSYIQQIKEAETIDQQVDKERPSRIGRPLEKDEPDHKMMCYLPESLFETFKEGRLEEKFQNDRAFYVHIFATYFKGKHYNKYQTAIGGKKGNSKQKTKPRKG